MIQIHLRRTKDRPTSFPTFMKSQINFFLEITPSIHDQIWSRENREIKRIPKKKKKRINLASRLSERGTPPQKKSKENQSFEKNKKKKIIKMNFQGIINF